MIDLDGLTADEAAAYAAGLREALDLVDDAVDGKRSAAGLGTAGREIHRRSKRAAGRAALAPARRPLEAPPAVRQSLIGTWDACPLSAKFELETETRQSPGQMGYLGARGILFHVWRAHAIQWMRREKLRSIPAAKGLELLVRVVAQRDADDEDVVHLPMNEIRWLRVLVTKSCEHEIDIHRIVDVERRLFADIDCVGPDGRRYVRTVTGTPDVLMAGPGDHEAEIIDWKSGFAPPAAKRDPPPGEAEREDRLSDMGYVQQTVYGWLVMKNYPAVRSVTEHEYYVFHDEEREATVVREDMERIEDVLASVVSQIDAAVESGPRSKRWIPVAGAHCGWCLRPRDCPISRELGIPATEREAQRVIHEWIVAGQVRSERAKYGKGWVEKHGPIEILHSKGRRAAGWIPNSTGNGRRFAMYEPEDAAPSPFDERLEDAARERGALVE